MRCTLAGGGGSDGFPVWRCPIGLDHGPRPTPWDAFECLLQSACLVAHICPGTVTPDFLAPILQAVDALPEGSGPHTQGRARVLAVTSLCTRVGSTHDLAAALLSSGLLEPAISVCEAMEGSDEAGAQQAACLQACLHTALKLVQSASETSSRLAMRETHPTAGKPTQGKSGTPGATAEGAPVDAPGLRQLKGRELARQLQRVLLPRALDAAAAQQQHWEQAGGRQDHRLQLARAAAARSCANLRCADVTLAGGPDAGSGRGCKRCSGCRAVWYCSAACSRADWRTAGGGHKWTCAALAEERAGQKQLAAAGSS